MLNIKLHMTFLHLLTRTIVCVWILRVCWISPVEPVRLLLGRNYSRNSRRSNVFITELESKCLYLAVWCSRTIVTLRLKCCRVYCLSLPRAKRLPQKMISESLNFSAQCKQCIHSMKNPARQISAQVWQLWIMSHLKRCISVRLYVVN